MIHMLSMKLFDSVNGHIIPHCIATCANVMNAEDKFSCNDAHIRQPKRCLMI